MIYWIPTIKLTHRQSYQTIFSDGGEEEGDDDDESGDGEEAENGEAAVENGEKEKNGEEPAAADEKAESDVEGGEKEGEDKSAQVQLLPRIISYDNRMYVLMSLYCRMQRRRMILATFSWPGRCWSLPRLGKYWEVCRSDERPGCVHQDSGDRER